ncbi:MAG TPA: hypothetical protein PKD24_02185 [Pyrinomonadaceae bacterium]|nr:hypothetical protein [Pyrinomonadaceae bacterium]HMP64032.1 hypothetical protein [Pyrinomonadaceae bacterium]
MKDEKDEKEQPENGDEATDRNFAEAAVVTTSGSYPKNGFERTPIRQKISVILKKAANKLEITDTTDWVATVGEQEVNPDSSYLDCGLSGEVEIDYGPREGGGGHA